MTLRSTDLTLFVERCPAAVQHRRQNTPIDRDGFATGIAAHAMLQALGESPDTDPDVVIDRVSHILLTEGRAFDGVTEPPLPPDAVLDARALAAAAWLVWPFPTGARCETGHAIDARGNATPYAHPKALARGILDLIYTDTIEVDGEPFDGVVVRDYKTNWTARADDLPNAEQGTRTRRQMRLYALFAVAAHPDAAFVRVEVANVRTLQIHEATIWLDEAGRAMLDAWLAEVRILAAAMDASRPTPRPGAGCPGCPYVRACRPAEAVVGLDDATRLAALEAEREALRAVLRGGPSIPIPGGYVGYRAATERTPNADALHRAYERHVGQIADDLTGAFLGTIKPTMGALNQIAAKSIPARRGDTTYKAEREAMVQALSREIVAGEFGVWTDDQPTKETP